MTITVSRRPDRGALYRLVCRVSALSARVHPAIFLWPAVGLVLTALAIWLGWGADIGQALAE